MHLEKGAVNYPISMMSRSMYQFIPEILAFKNVEGRMMILYDVEERLSLSIAGNLPANLINFYGLVSNWYLFTGNWFEKGIENFAVLTGTRNTQFGERSFGDWILVK